MSKRYFTAGDLVGVQWEDAVGWTERWVEVSRFVEDAHNVKGCIVQSAGIVLEHTKEHLLLAGSLHIGRASEVHRIPGSAIREIKRLRVMAK